MLAVALSSSPNAITRLQAIDRTVQMPRNKKGSRYRRAVSSYDPRNILMGDKKSEFSLLALNRWLIKVSLQP
jgi:restriction endonuclease